MDNIKIIEFFFKFQNQLLCHMYVQLQQSIFFHDIRSRRLRWTVHVAHIGEKRNAQCVVMGKLEGKRSFGRHRRRWEDNINQGGSVWTGFIWLRVQIIGFHRVREISWLAEELKASQGRFCSSKSVIRLSPVPWLSLWTVTFAAYVLVVYLLQITSVNEIFLPVKSECQNHTDYSQFRKVCIPTLQTLHLWAVLWNAVDPATVHWRKPFVWTTIECCTDSEPWTLSACRTDNWNKTSVMEWRLPGTLVL